MTYTLSIGAVGMPVARNTPLYPSYQGQACTPQNRTYRRLKLCIYFLNLL